jgi:hypothetical protein
LGLDWFLRGLIERIRGLIVRILKFERQLGTWLKKSKIQNQTEKRRMILGVKIDQIEGQIEENSKFNG